MAWKRLLLVLFLFAVAWAALMSIRLASNASDVPLFHTYGVEFRHGKVPYRDFSVEYPPAALVPFELPALVSTTTRGYRIAFEVLMGIFGAGTIAASAFLLHRLGGRRVIPLLFIGAALVGLGPLSLGHFDLWPALLVSAGLAALAYRRRTASGVIVGVAIAAKIYPAVLVPLIVVHVWRERGRREAVEWLVAAAVAVSVWFVPFIALAPHGVYESVRSQLDRPLQLESSAAAALVAAHQLAGIAIGVEFSHTSVNLGGGKAAAAAAATSALEIAVLLALWLVFARRSYDLRGLVRAATAAVVAFVCLGKVLSPQFLIWLVPLTPLLGEALAVGASAAIVGAVILTRLYFPGRWADLIRLEALPTWLLVARDALLILLLATLAAAVVKRPIATLPSRQRTPR